MREFFAHVVHRNIHPIVFAQQLAASKALLANWMPRMHGDD